MRALAFLAALGVSPWLHPLAFHPLAGWVTAASGNTRSVYAGAGKHVVVPLESTAWIARNVRYRDDATADPPNRTLAHLQPSSVIVWAVIFAPAYTGQKPIQLDLRKARHSACCEAIGLAAGEYELTGDGPGGVYSVIVRIYFGSRPAKASRAEAQEALRQLVLPLPR